MSTAKRVLAAVFTSALLVGVASSPALASDHLLNAKAATGINPVTDNPSGTSGAKAQPDTVPGEGNPNFGNDRGTPAVDLDEVNVRSGDNGHPQVV